MILKKYYPAIYLLLALCLGGCTNFGKKEGEIQIPEGITEEQLQEQRYDFKHNKAYKESFLHQDNTDSAIITIFNVVKYQIRDDEANIGEGFDYYIFDIGVDNFMHQPFSIGAFTRSCNLSTSDTSYHFSNVGFALKMYSLQTDSSEIDMEHIKKFYQPQMPAREYYRAKLFAYEVSRDEKDALIFHYKIGNRSYNYTVRGKQY